MGNGAEEVVASFSAPESLRAFFVEDAFSDEIVDRAAGVEVRIQLKKGFRPESFSLKMTVDERFDPRIADLDEATCVVAVVPDQALPEIEYVQTVFPALIDGDRIQISRAQEREQL